MMPGAPRTAFISEPQKLTQFLYRMEESRGYDSKGDLWSPGSFRLDLVHSVDASLLASTESWETIEAVRPAEAAVAEIERRKRLLDATHPRSQSDLAAELVLAADQFIIQPAGAARMRAAGDEIRTIIAGYHWFTDWGRDTMISLEGLTLVTGRHVEAGYILRTFAHYIRDGLIPNLFPERNGKGSIIRPTPRCGFSTPLPLPGVYWRPADPADSTAQTRSKSSISISAARGSASVSIRPMGCCSRGPQGYQLTWMDAKVGDWVVTPRRGKPVEINALWYNALG